MAPKTRSSRAPSRNASRPSTPLDTSSLFPSSSVSEATRPRKQRKSAHNARGATDLSQESLLGQETKTTSPYSDQQLTGQTTTLSCAQLPPSRWDEPWVEPELPPPTPSYKFDSKKGEKTYHLASTTPLGVLPSISVRRRLGLMPTAKSSTPIPAKNNGTKSAKSTPTGDYRPGTASTSADEPGPSESPFMQSGFPSLPNGEKSLSPTRSTMGNNSIEPEIAPVNGHPLTPTLLSTPPTLKYPQETILKVVDAAIARAEELKDIKVANGLKQIRDATAKDQFLFAVLEGVFSKEAGPHEKSRFQTVMRDAVRKDRSKHSTHEAIAMTRTQSSASNSSSLSSAKSLDAETFAPAMTSGRAANSVPHKRKGRRATGPHAKGKKRSVPARSQSVFPSLEDTDTRKRKRMDDLEYSDEVLAAKRLALRKTFNDFPVPESHIRPSRTPVTIETASPSPHPAPSTSSKRSREIFESSESGDEVEVAPAIPQKPPKRTRKSVAPPDEIDNIDFCRLCNGSGQLLCCDGCIDSFHFECLAPPMDPKSPPEGQWFCPTCRVKGTLGPLIETVENMPPKNYELPPEIREFFAGAKTGEHGAYKAVPILPKGGSRTRGNRTGRPEDRNALLRLTDAKGRLITCIRCGLTSNGRRPIIQCDYCPCSWHLDCLDPPRSNPPPQVPGSENRALHWKCPNHIDHDLASLGGLGRGRFAQIRRPRNPKFIDIEILPSDSEAERFSEQEIAGAVYRVPERGVIMDFVSRVKRGYAEAQALAAIKAAAARTVRVTATPVAPGRVSNAQGAEDTVSSNGSTQEAVMVSGAQNLGNNTDADADAALSLLAPAERDAVIALGGIAAVTQSAALAYPERAAQLVNQLLANVPESARKDTDEISLLRAIQDLANQRIQALTSDSATTN
ncbi:conserved hypothetical protein [Histoplasma capsulatum var. duboisii H88]|uniref:PHD-type domain-containing protein n=1 Tax=Ajellomyces capsulatus (strain H88) TaxID=544711 RepID=F0UB58_AJEC8|nr:conserved hypothetical protein [Histoplasma capsulatum var. duboisii H88]